MEKWAGHWRQTRLGKFGLAFAQLVAVPGVPNPNHAGHWRRSVVPLFEVWRFLDPVTKTPIVVVAEKMH